MQFTLHAGYQKARSHISIQKLSGSFSPFFFVLPFPFFLPIPLLAQDGPFLPRMARRLPAESGQRSLADS